VAGPEEAVVDSAHADVAEVSERDVRLRRRLRRGDLVEVRSPGEILRTLDARGTTAGLPFMPEMVAACGARFAVERRADKVCDTIDYRGSRRMHDCVLLDGVRCDGSGHDGCQAACRVYWNEAWLRPVEPGEPARSGGGDRAATVALRRLAAASARANGKGGANAAPSANGANGANGGGGVRYRCQATEMLAASVPLSLTDPRPYVREWASGNVTIARFARVMARATVTEARRKLGRLPVPPLAGPSRTSPATPPLDLRPGEWVRVRSPAEIRATLTSSGKHRGLWFDTEMLRHCGRTYRVRRRIARLVDERDGRMIELTSDCVTLEGVECSGEWSPQRWFCPRALHPYWRECWLERVPTPGG
jgi:hypothetical protein